MVVEGVAIISRPSPTRFATPQNAKLASVKSYVVTGASTGIGYATALRLAKNARVFAGVRNARDHDALGAAAPNVVPVYLDVTDPDTIAQAKATIAEQTAGELDGLVNNAGIAVAAPLEMVERLRATVSAVGADAEVELYPGVEHGFAFPQRGAYNRDAAERHWERLFALFGRNLAV